MDVAAQEVLEPTNPLTLDVFEHGNYHDVLCKMRRECPVHWTPADAEMNGYWSITKYEDVLFVSRHPEIFSSAEGIRGPGLRHPERYPNPTSIPGAASMITMDPPLHSKMRRLVNRGFTPKAVDAMEPRIRQIATTILDRMADRSSCDFVRDIASQLPLAVICGLVGGIEERHWPAITELTRHTLGASDPEYQADVVDATQRGTIAAQNATSLVGRMEMIQFFRAFLEQRRREPGDDLLSTLLTAELDGDRLSDVALLSFCFLLAVAGNETTLNAIACGLQALCEHPAERARLQADPSLLDSAIEETLRWTSPLHHMSRVARSDVTIRGQLIRAGERVLMWYGSANRDEDVFAEPDRFDITRAPNDHLAFGTGEHFCLGAGLARIELKVMFQELFRRLPDIELAGQPERLRSNFINGIKRMPVTFTPERRG